MCFFRVNRVPSLRYHSRDAPSPRPRPSLHRLLALAFLAFTLANAHALSDRELASIGQRVWQNECGGTREGLTSWNSGENFASLGIGHFIWYPQGVRGPFEESFPGLVKFLDANRVKLPAWLKPGMACPWRTRAEFLAAAKGKQMTELRDLLATTVALQSRFLAQRMEAALPKLLAATSAARRAHVKKQFEKLAANGKGTFALIDYVNFKGEGTKPEERYNGRGWGLLQAIEGMDDEGSIAEAFAASAARVLAQRVKNSPPERDEAKWLPGWVRRVEAYAR
ncbi:hypothetical protein LBMAG57_20610 [Verrucomicrobiota bacterium]|nr:hypothetical protein LBMAG57_20610 [Verrucomicrobiota bacterium]